MNQQKYESQPNTGNIYSQNTENIQNPEQSKKETQIVTQIDSVNLSREDNKLKEESSQNAQNQQNQQIPESQKTDAITNPKIKKIFKEIK